MLRVDCTCVSAIEYFHKSALVIPAALMASLMLKALGQVVTCQHNQYTCFVTECQALIACLLDAAGWAYAFMKREPAWPPIHEAEAVAS